jgi:hypothetical protein
MTFHSFITHGHSNGPFNFPPGVINVVRVEILLAAAGRVGVLTSHDGGSDPVIVIHLTAGPELVHIFPISVF